MRFIFKGKARCLQQALSCLLVVCLAGYGFPVPSHAADQTEASPPSLNELVQMPYVQLFEQASELRISKKVIEDYRQQLEREKDREKDALERQEDSLEERIDEAQDELKKLNKSTAHPPDIEQRRHVLHCRIQALRNYLQGTKIARQKGLEINYDNQFAKLKVLEEWPATYRRILQAKETGQVIDRKFSDYKDIGFRNDTFDDQEDDVERGREAIEELNRRNMLPPEVEDPVVTDYVRRLGQRLARHSDLQVPIHVTVLRSEEINAFMLPGGFMFVNSGLILEAEKESELAGVMAHEIAHAAARHSHRLMKRATIAEILFTAAQIAALVFTGGVGSLATYYALQYGFYGLGLFLNLQLLGVNRDYEIESDILGTQYLWHAGYNTRGFVNFFDKMAQKKGYITGLSWFRTHPPFYERMEVTYREITILPEPEQAIDDTKEFHQVRSRLQEIAEEMKRKDREAPTLRRVYECEDVEVDIEVEVDVTPQEYEQSRRFAAGASCAGD